MAKSATPRQDCIFPPVFAINAKSDLGSIQQIAVPSQSQKVVRDKSRQVGKDSYVISPLGVDTAEILVRTRNAASSNGFGRIIEVADQNANRGRGKLDLSAGQWIEHPGIQSGKINYEERVKQVSYSWQGAFSFSGPEKSSHLTGLREPQDGAIHAIHAHWTVSHQPGTVVMPTGTGKTEVMLAILVAQQLDRLLVIVPTDALRTQIANRFLSLGILKEIGAVSEKALYPIVGMLSHIPKSIREVDDFFKKCNVIVTTMQTAGQCEEKIQKRMAKHCPYLFIDEAHHVAAKTWAGLKESFREDRILQFTATPFRNDDKLVEGKIIFNYPLLKAQEEGYFKTIQFKPVKEYNPLLADQKIADKAVEQLRQDIKNGFNHVLMARVDSIKRAERIFSIYAKYDDLNPVQIHSDIKSESTRRAIREQILRGHAKIVVCVDMLGEGFDLPELKIAAFHDVKKSLPVTLQLAGRFTRARKDLGTPTFIANIGDITVQNELRKLYAQNADWNILLRQSSQTVIQKQVELWEFLEGFKKFPKDITLQNVKPTLYTVAYRTKCNMWTPESFRDGLDNKESFEHMYDDINHKDKTLIITAAKKNPVDWADMEGIFNLEWELYVLFWDNKRNLLFINTSGWKGFCRHLAEAVAGSDVELINGNQIFRCLSGLNRLKLHNVGLREIPGGYVTYTMRAGPDVAPALSQALIKKTVKSNFAGVGYDDDETLDYDKRRTYLGCSYRGRIWSNQAEDLSELKKQCLEIGRKLLNNRLNPNRILEGTLVPQMITMLPAKELFDIQWPEVFYSEPENAHQFIVDNRRALTLTHTGIRLKSASGNKVLFEIYSDFEQVAFEVVLNIYEKDGLSKYSFSLPGRQGVTVRQRTKEFPLEEFFYENPPLIWFYDGSYLEGNQYVELPRTYVPYPVQKIRGDWIDWAKTKINLESQGIERNPESIQYNVIRKLMLDPGYCLIFDDDDSGEAADIVCVQDSRKLITVEFYHCKYSKGKEAGSRIGDLYEVCGQAQKSIQWAIKPEELFAHLEEREQKRIEKLRKDNPGMDEANLAKRSRFDKGDMNILAMLKNKSMNVRTLFRIFIVQPGLSKSKPSREQLELLSVTQNYLLEMFNIPFGVIAGK